MRQRKHSKLSLLWKNFLILSLTKFIDSSLLFKTFAKCSVFNYESIETCREVILVGTLPSYIYNNILNLSINAIFAMFEIYNFWWLKILNLRTCFQFFNLRRLERYRIVFDEVTRYHYKSPPWMDVITMRGGGGWGGVECVAGGLISLKLSQNKVRQESVDSDCSYGSLNENTSTSRTNIKMWPQWRLTL